MCVCESIPAQDDPPRKHRAVGSNHRSWFGIFELKRVWSKGCVCGISAECKQHFAISDANDCARTLNFNDAINEAEAVSRLRAWLAMGASVEREYFNYICICDVCIVLSVSIA